MFTRDAASTRTPTGTHPKAQAHTYTHARAQAHKRTHPHSHVHPQSPTPQVAYNPNATEYFATVRVIGDCALPAVADAINATAPATPTETSTTTTESVPTETVTTTTA